MRAQRHADFWDDSGGTRRLIRLCTTNVDESELKEIKSNALALILKI